MSDASVALIARYLAIALNQAAYTRAPEDKKEVAQLQTELCAAVVAEREEKKKEEEP